MGRERSSSPPADFPSCFKAIRGINSILKFYGQIICYRPPAPRKDGCFSILAVELPYKLKQSPTTLERLLRALSQTHWRQEFECHVLVQKKCILLYTQMGEENCRMCPCIKTEEHKSAPAKLKLQSQTFWVFLLGCFDSSHTYNNKN